MQANTIDDVVAQLDEIIRLVTKQHQSPWVFSGVVSQMTLRVRTAWATGTFDR